MATIERLALTDFRRRVVAGAFPDFQRLADALRWLQFVQADPIRSPARAQDLMLRQRVDGYVAGDLEATFPDLDAEEGYLFAYGFMTPEVWRQLRWRPNRKLKKLERDVLDAVAELGEVHPRGLDERFGRKAVKNYWGGKSQQTKRILEHLHHHGYLRVVRREKGIRVYQVPEQSDGQDSDPRGRYRRLVMTTVHVFGASTKQMVVSELRSHNHLLPSRQERMAAVESLMEDGHLKEVQVAGITYLWRREHWLDDEVPDRVRILAPFDPLVRDRARFQQLWGWDYRFEAYVPAAKRIRGYYAMPVLWRDRVIGWANANMIDDRLDVQLGYVSKRPREKAFRMQAEAEVEATAKFLGLDSGAWELAL
ncbi:DNA glycosylase AlkZ-like family protein [Stieleria sp.]|uniref:DNA glycosylase AlkZ-like family protein n=1 Tax=Stieleria sp. TaxID=2795976 RepID=UPI0035650838